jgi:tetratricopeptide (TPR) repeat protein
MRPALAVALAAALVYVPTLWYDFVWDDLILIRDRLHLYTLSNLPRLLFSDLFSGGEWGDSSFFRPLVVLSYFIDLKVWGLTPMGFHLTNVVAHALTAAGVAMLAARLTGSRAASAVAGLLFAVHPVHTETVAFVSSRTDLFATLFTVAAVLAYGRWRDSGATGAGVLSVSAFALAIASKEVAIVVPALLLLHDALARRDPRTTGSWRAALPRMAPYAAVLVVYLALRRLALSTFVMAPVTPWADAVTRVLTSLKMAAWYVWLAIVPLPTNLSYEIARDTMIPGARWWLCMAVLAVIAALSLVAVRRRPTAAFAIAWFWLGLIPVLGASVLPTRKPLMSDHFMYLPMVGMALLWAEGASLALRATRAARRIAAVATAVVLVAYAGLTLWRSDDWRDEYRLTARAVETSPEAVQPRLNLAMNQLQLGQVAAARANLQFAAQRVPDDAVVLSALALAETALGAPDQGRARAERAMALAPSNTIVLNYAAEVYGQLGDFGKTAEILERSLAIRPDQISATMTLATVRSLLGHYEAAIAAADRGAELNRRTHQHDLLIDKVTAQITMEKDPARSKAAWTRYIEGLRRLPRTPQVEAEAAAAERLLRTLSSR